MNDELVRGALRARHRFEAAHVDATLALAQIVGENVVAACHRQKGETTRRTHVLHTKVSQYFVDILRTSVRVLTQIVGENVVSATDKAKNGRPMRIVYCSEVL